MFATLFLLIALIAFASCEQMCLNRTEWSNSQTCGNDDDDYSGDLTVVYPLDVCFRMNDGTYKNISLFYDYNQVPSIRYKNYGFDSTCKDLQTTGGGDPFRCVRLNKPGRFWRGLAYPCPVLETAVPTTSVPSGATFCVTQETFIDYGCSGTPISEEVVCNACNPANQKMVKCDLERGAVEVAQYESFDTTCQGSKTSLKKYATGECINTQTKFRPITYCSAAATAWPMAPPATFVNPCIKVQSGFAAPECTTPANTSYIPCGNKCTFVENLNANVRVICNDVKNLVNLKFYYDSDCKVVKDDQKMKQGNCYGALLLSDFAECPAAPPPPPVPAAADFTGQCASIMSYSDTLCATPDTSSTKLYPCNQQTLGTKYGDITVNCFSTPDTAIQILIANGVLTVTMDKAYKSQCVSGDAFVGFTACPAAP